MLCISQRVKFCYPNPLASGVRLVHRVLVFENRIYLYSLCTVWEAKVLLAPQGTLNRTVKKR